MPLTIAGGTRVSRNRKDKKNMNHHRLKCYSLLLETAKSMPSLLRQIPRGESYMIDQLKRALASAILNLSEGNGRTSLKERSRFFDISMASISECMACLDVLEAYSSVPSAFLKSVLCSNLKLAYAMIRRLKVVYSIQ